MDMMQKLVGKEHPDTLISIGSLASTYREQGRWNEAEQLEVQVMNIRKKLLDEEHPKNSHKHGKSSIQIQKSGKVK